MVRGAGIEPATSPGWWGAPSSSCPRFVLYCGDSLSHPLSLVNTFCLVEGAGIRACIFPISRIVLCRSSEKESYDENYTDSIRRPLQIWYAEMDLNHRPPPAPGGALYLD